MVIALSALITITWFHVNGMWGSAAWQLPTVYQGPYVGRDKSDILVYSAFVRAARDGHFSPFCSKFVPELGAPYEANWNDWPFLEYLPLYLIGALARVVGIFAALNIALLCSHLLAGITFYCIARYRKVDIVWSFAAALAFGLASFIFSQSPDHPMVALCWHVPLFLLVWGWLADERELAIGSKRFWIGMAIGVLAGVQNPYYSVTFCQLVLLTTMTMSIRTNRIDRLLIGLWFIGATVFGFVLMNFNAWIWQLRLGQSSGAIVRQFQWVEIYALKLLDLFVPPLNHQVAAFRAAGLWRSHIAILHDEGSYVGIIGAAALAILIAIAARAAIKRQSEIPAAAWQVLWIFAFYTTDGLNAILAAAGFTFLRAGCRLSVVILAILLLFTAEWLTKRMRSTVATSAAAVCCLIVFIDQVPQPISPEQQRLIAQQISADRDFVANMETVLPPGAMVFQLPVMDFPEAPLRTVNPYDHLRPYLFSRQLRFSFGSMKGRPREQWQHDLEKMPLAESLAEIKKHGFSALYINRVAYPDRAKELEQNLRNLGYHQEIENAEGDVFCVVLQ